MPDPRVPKPWQVQEGRPPVPKAGPEKPCQWCGDAFQPSRAWSKYCSVNCRDRHFDAYHPRMFNPQVGERLQLKFLAEKKAELDAAAKARRRP